MRKLLHQCMRVFGAKSERVMVVEEVDKHFEITDALVNNHEKTIRVKRLRFADCLEDIPSPLILQNSIVLALGEKKATTVESLSRFRRQNSKDKIKEEELDGLLFKALWSFLNQYRSWAAQKMGGNELDLVLANVEIGDITIDGNRVVNPVGNFGRECVIQFRGTFVIRDILKSISPFASWTNSFSIVERGSIISSAIRKEKTATVFVSGDSSVVFINNNSELRFHYLLQWGLNQIIEVIIKQFNVSYIVACKILKLYCEHSMSEKMIHTVGRAIHGALDTFLKEKPFSIKKSKASLSNMIYVSFHQGIPIPKEEFESYRIRITPIEQMLQDRDFSISIDRRLHEYALNGHQTVLTLLAKLNSYPSHKDLTQLLSRRARWLTTTISHEASHIA